MQHIYRTFSVLVLFVVTVVSAQAQIPNPSFENWTDGQPDGWYTYPIGSTDFGTESNTAHAGTKAVKMAAEDIGGGNVFTGGLITGNENTTRYGCNCHPDALHFWYILHPVDGEQIFVDIAATNIGLTLAGAGSAFITDNNDVYKEYVVPMIYNTSDNLDSMSIGILLHGTANPLLHVGAYFIVDDLSWGPATSVEQLSPAAATLEFVGTSGSNTNIVYSLSRRANVQLDVYDVTGRLVKSVLNSTQTAGRYKAVEDFSTLTNGVYFCKLTVDGESFSKAFAVTR